MTSYHILMATLVVCTLILAVSVFRIKWIFRQFDEQDEVDPLRRLSAYDEMMNRWWCWDIDKFLEKPSERKQT